VCCYSASVDTLSAVIHSNPGPIYLSHLTKRCVSGLSAAVCFDAAINPGSFTMLSPFEDRSIAGLQDSRTPGTLCLIAPIRCGGLRCNYVRYSPQLISASPILARRWHRYWYLGNPEKATINYFIADHKQLHSLLSRPPLSAA